MEATTIGKNRTGAAVSPDGTEEMLQAVNRYSPPTALDTSLAMSERMLAIDEADPMGSIPPPASIKGTLKNGVSAWTGGNPSIFMDKLGERIAFERTGTRLYDALITKCEALVQQGESPLPEIESSDSADPSLPATIQRIRDDGALETLMRIRGEELAHFRMLCDAMKEMGGDPTAQTPCADVTAVASMGFMQAITDPRTTLAQCLNVIQSAELTDNAGWETLADLAEREGQTAMAQKFLAALSEEQQHLHIVNAWLYVLLEDAVGSAAV